VELRDTVPMEITLLPSIHANKPICNQNLHTILSLADGRVIATKVCMVGSGVRRHDINVSISMVTEASTMFLKYAFAHPKDSNPANSRICFAFTACVLNM
jgi:hypothetical protein